MASLKHGEKASLTASLVSRIQSFLQDFSKGVSRAMVSDSGSTSTVTHETKTATTSAASSSSSASASVVPTTSILIVTHYMCIGTILDLLQGSSPAKRATAVQSRESNVNHTGHVHETEADTETIIPPPSDIKVNATFELNTATGVDLKRHWGNCSFGTRLGHCWHIRTQV
jgi:hypothetical protein